MLAASLGFRYGLLEAHRLPVDCAGDWNGACLLKNVMVQIFAANRLGIAALVVGASAFALQSRVTAWVGWLLGLAGLVLYCADDSAVGAVLALMVLVGCRSKRRKGEEESDQHPGDGGGVGGLA